MSAVTFGPWESSERDAQDRWGRAAARILPRMVGTGCRPSVTLPRVGGIGSTPERAAATGASGPAPREFRLQAPGPHTMPGRVDRWGRAAARTLPRMVGTGCRPSVISPRVGGIGSTPERAAATGASGPAPREFRLQAPGPQTMPGRADARSRTRPSPASRVVCDAPHAAGNSAPRSTIPRHIRRTVRPTRLSPVADESRAPVQRLCLSSQS